MAFSSERSQWCWGSLRPWQILHSRLAERDSRGKTLDVWELIDETLGAADSRDRSGVDDDDDERRQELNLLGDDGEFWRHGGVMEARIRDWLARREEGELGDQALQQQLQIRRQAEQANVAEEAAMVVSKLSYRSAIATELRAGATTEAVEEEDEDEDENEEDEDDEDEEEDEDDEDGEEEAILAAPLDLAIVPLDLATRQLSDEVPDLCAVCLDTLLPTQPLLRLPCRHVFHSPCLAPWLQQGQPGQPGQQRRCPCCRSAISAPAGATTLYLEPPPQTLNVAATTLYVEAPPTLQRYSHTPQATRSHHVHSTTPPPVITANTTLNPIISAPITANNNAVVPQDIMCLLADMEAALDRLGFRS